MAPPPKLRVARPPLRPLLLFDGDCGFCRAWVARWKDEVGDRVDVAASQEQGSRFPEIPLEEFRRSVQLVLPDGSVVSGAEAIFTALAEAGRRGWLRSYESLPGFAPVSEKLYVIVARHRQAASALTRLLWGRDVSKPRFGTASAIFLRLLGVVFFTAFVSLWAQIHGLIGSRGILPIAPFLSAVAEQIGPVRFWLLPTLCWWASGDAALHVFCAAGTVLSLLLVAGLYPAACLALLAVLYLSLSVAGQVFFSFQWDYLLVETAFLALLLAPLSRRIRFSAAGPSRLALFLLRWLLFRLNFSSGVVKLASHDPTWRSLTALDFHYQTQPLPTWIAWFMQQMPSGTHKATVLLLFVAELVVPFLIFGPRRLRLFACACLIGLQLAIAATGNFAFFNLLASLLAVLLLDDQFLERFRPRDSVTSAPTAATDRPARAWPRRAVAVVAIVVLPLSLVEVGGSFGSAIPWPSPLIALARAVSPLRIVNGYGLFAVMTTRRPEIIVEGSADGLTWKPYAFRWKPGDPLRRPGFVAPHQPRVDWQMWFAALGTPEENDWFERFEDRLLEGSPEVLALLGPNPFPGAPPRAVRATLWEYRFTDAATRRRTGAWWAREELGPYGLVRERR